MVSGVPSPESSSPVAGSDCLDSARKRHFESDRLSDSDDDIPLDAEVGPLVGQIRDFERSRREFLERAAPGAKVPRATISKTLGGGVVFATRPRPRIGPEFQAELPPLPSCPRPPPPPLPTLTLLEESLGGGATLGGALGALREGDESEEREELELPPPAALTPSLLDRPVARLAPRDEGSSEVPVTARAPTKRRGLAAPRRALPRD